MNITLFRNKEIVFDDIVCHIFGLGVVHKPCGPIFQNFLYILISNISLANFSRLAREVLYLARVKDWLKVMTTTSTTSCAHGLTFMICTFSRTFSKTLRHIIIALLEERSNVKNSNPAVVWETNCKYMHMLTNLKMSFFSSSSSEFFGKDFNVST